MADKFYYGTDLCLSKNILKTLTHEITVKAPEKYRWTMKYPEKEEDILDAVMLETTVFGTWNETTKKWEEGYKRYLKLFKPPVASLNAKETELLNKYNYNGAFTQEEIDYLKKWYQGSDFTEEETNVIKNWYSNPTNPEDNCHSLNDIEHITGFSDRDIIIMKSIVYVRGFENADELLKLYAKQFRGDSLTEKESKILQDDILKRHPSVAEMSKINLIKQRRGLNNFVYKNEDETISISISDRKLCVLIIFDSIGQASTSASSINITYPDDYDKPISDIEILASYRRSRVLNTDELTTVLELQGKLNNNNALMWQIGSEINEDTPSEFVDKKCSLPARMAWYKYVHTNLIDFAGLEYWLNLTNDCLNIVIRGDAATDISPYKNWLKTYGYIGVLNPMNEDSDEDKENNWCMTIGSDIEPSINNTTSTENLSLESQTYGFRTANGVTDITIMGTKIGLPYQPHYPAFFTANPTMDKVNIDGSRWNKKKKQFSEIIATHTFDGERGKMKNVLIGEDTSINDGDRLMYQPTRENNEEPEMYLKFKINAPYNFMQNSPNVNQCIAIRVSMDEFFSNNYCENCDYKEFAVDNGYNNVN